MRNIDVTYGRDHRLSEGFVALSMPRAAWHVSIEHAMRLPSKEDLSNV
jgi:hypothetical protein